MRMLADQYKLYQVIKCVPIAYINVDLIDWSLPTQQRNSGITASPQPPLLER